MSKRVKNMTQLNKPVSLFKGYFDTNPVGSVGILDFLTDPSNRNQAERIAEMEDKADRDAAKALLPAITPSCRCEQRRLDRILSLSGLICIEGDAKDLPAGVTALDLVKHTLPKIPVIGYAGLSISRLGWFAIVTVSKPEKHQEHWLALQEAFKRTGITIDPAPKSLISLRGYAYNDAGSSFVNPRAEIFTGLIDPRPVKPITPPTGRDIAKVQREIDRMIAEKRNVTANYDTWMRLGMILAVAFGESGRAWFHDISKPHAEYDAAKTDKKFDSFLNRGYSKIGMGSFFRLIRGTP